MAKLVKFKNGKYGVKRKWLFIFTEYMSLYVFDSWWFKSETYAVTEFCMGTYKEAKKSLDKLKQGVKEEKEL